jgi:hypothetical protein
MDAASVPPILDVWRALGGGDLRRGRGRAFWRGGDGLHVAIEPKKNAWFDFARGEGGGVLDLVERARGCDRAAAGAWLRDLVGVPDQPLAPSSRRRFARAKALAVEDSRRAWRWSIGAAERLNEAKLAAVDYDAGRMDCRALESAARALREIEESEPGALLLAWRRAWDKNPILAAADEMAGRAHERRGEMLARAVAKGLMGVGNKDAT